MSTTKFTQDTSPVPLTTNATPVNVFPTISGTPDTPTSTLLTLQSLPVTPSKLLYPATKENISKRKQYITEHFASSVFSTDSPFLSMLSFTQCCPVLSLTQHTHPFLFCTIGNNRSRRLLMMMLKKTSTSQCQYVSQ